MMIGGTDSIIPAVIFLLYDLYLQEWKGRWNELSVIPGALRERMSNFHIAHFSVRLRLLF